MKEKHNMPKGPLPNFVVIGAFKGATTALARRLSEHPDVYIAPVKETHFFAEDHLYAEGLDGYRGFFSTHSNESAIGDVSPTYARSKRYPLAAERLSSALPEAKLIYILRDPIARMESHWIEARRGGWPVPPFNEAVFSDATDIVESSCYWKELNLYRKQFPDDRILILFTEDFNDDPHAVLENVYRFLDVDAGFVNPGLGIVERPSEGAYADKDWTARYLRSGVGKLVSGMMPRKLINILRPLVRQKVISRPTWDRNVLEKSIEMIKPDAEQILQFAEKPKNFWKLGSDRSVK